MEEDLKQALIEVFLIESGWIKPKSLEELLNQIANT